MGWASRELGQTSLLFVDYCRATLAGDASAQALDLGAAYGAASLAALRAGAFVIANDLDSAQLAELDERARAECDAAMYARLSLKPGRFPSEIQCGPASLGAVHASNVFHFLSGPQLDLGFRRIAGWLRPGGKLFVQAATPYQSPFAAFVPEYRKRLEQAARWPGWIEKLSVYCSHRQVSQMPRSIHLLDDRVLAEAASQAGLEVQAAWLYRRADLPVSLHWDGRETVGLIAARPLSG